ncbi:PKD domain-containing protein [Arthrobacter mangrovi]|uniref:PKD domain-containing protein n=1 Tax=Arthrobacter mangrovi TaxID=2966350 RepID=UPI0035A245BA
MKRANGQLKMLASSKDLKVHRFGAVLASGLVSIFIPFVAKASEPTPLWDETGVKVGGYVPLPGTDFWGKLPSVPGISDAQYRFEVACLDGDDIEIACLPTLPACDAGDDGSPVQWFWRSASLGMPDWSAHPDYGCVYSSNPEDVLDDIADRILTEFRNLPIDAGSISTEPSPHTLIGANTNVYASVDSQTMEIGLLGQDIKIEATPKEYRWDYGDGSAPVSLATPGGPLPRERWGEVTPTSHVYESTGDYAVSLTTTFSGTYSVNGGPAIPIPGTGTFTAAPVTISVWRSVVNNYADNCLENPNGAGC